MRSLVLIVSTLLALEAQTHSKGGAPAPVIQRYLLNPAALKAKSPDAFKVRFTTSKGEFVIEIYRQWAPLGSDRFYNLLTHGFYDDASFFRVIPEFIAQFGMSAKPAVNSAWSNTGIKDDAVKQSNKRGRLTFATRPIPNSRTTQLFINLKDNPGLDEQGFAPIGSVIEGMDVVDKLYGGYGDNEPDQARIAEEGRKYLDQFFPKLDSIKSARLVPYGSPAELKKAISAGEITSIEAPMRAAARVETPARNVAPSPGLQFVPVPRCRLIDTRAPAGPLGGPALNGGVARSIPVLTSPCGIPATAKAYALNATVIPGEGPLGYLTLWPTGQTQPNASTLNSPDGATVANSAIIQAGVNGSVDVFALQNTDFVLDINGYFTTPGPNTLAFHPITPCRAIDTRGAEGTLGGPALAGNSSRDFPIQSSACGIPAVARAYSLKVTAAPHGFLGFITTWPAGEPRPQATLLNSSDGAVLSNAAIVPAGANGRSISFYSSDETDIAVDIDGYFSPPSPGGLDFFPIAPCRVVDTRADSIMNGGASRTLSLTTTCGLPTTAGAYSLNLTVQPPNALGYLTAWATGQPRPNVSTLNESKAIVTANSAIVSAGSEGSISVFVLNDTHLIIDVNGYFGH
jgi:cyclophilin family peptidyl-prolyl cis-trans isomerase